MQHSYITQGLGREGREVHSIRILIYVSSIPSFLTTCLSLHAKSSLSLLPYHNIISSLYLLPYPNIISPLYLLPYPNIISPLYLLPYHNIISPLYLLPYHNIISSLSLLPYYNIIFPSYLLPYYISLSLLLHILISPLFDSRSQYLVLLLL